MVYAEWDFKLSIPDKDGIPEREHLKVVEQQTGKTPLPLIAPDFPEVLDYLWEIFIKLSNTRGQGFDDPLPITYSEIKSWSEMTGTEIYPWEVDAVKRLDAVYVKVMKNG